MPYLSKFEKWNDLRNELKLGCMNHMDLKTRVSIRGTSRTERDLSDSQRFEIYLIFLDNSHMTTGISIEGREYQTSKISERKFQNEADVIPILSFLLKSANVEKLISYCEREESWNVLTHVDGSSPFYISTIFAPITTSSVSFFEKCAKDSIKYLKLVYHQEQPFPTERFLKCTSLDSCKKWQLILREIQDFGEDILKKWDLIDVDVDSSLTVSNFGDHTIHDFVAEFNGYQIVEQNDRMVRVVMRNTGKHILVKFPFQQYSEITVVPADYRENI